jgi:hypothetical protein
MRFHEASTLAVHIARTIGYRAMRANRDGVVCPHPVEGFEDTPEGHRAFAAVVEEMASHSYLLTDDRARALVAYARGLHHG